MKKATKSIGKEAPSVNDSLLENPDLLREIIDCIPNGLLIFDPQGHLIAYNENYRRLSRLTKEELDSHPSFEKILRLVIRKNKLIVTGENTEQWLKERIAAHGKEGEALEVEYRNGRWIKAQDRRTRSGYIIKTYEDITELKKREFRLVESSRVAKTIQKRLEDAIESISEGFVLFDSDDRLVTCNKNYRKLIGQASKKIRSGVPRLELIEAVAAIRFKGRPKKERENWIKLRLKHHNSPGKALECEFPNGSWIRYQDFKTNDGGRVSLYADITEKKENELALIKSEKRFNQAIEGLPDGLVIYDEKDRLILCNGRYRELIADVAPYLVPGQTYEKIIKAFAARSLTHLSAGEQKKWIKQRIQQHKNPGKPGEILFDNGTWVRYSDFKTEDGLLVSLLTDITELKDREEALLVSESLLEASHEKLVDAIESMSEDFSMFDADDKLVAYNSKFLKSFEDVPRILSPGIKLGEIMRFFAKKGFYGETDETIDKIVDARLKKLKTPGTYETHFSDGSWWVIKTDRTSDGGLVLVRNNITEQKLAERALRESEERYALAIKAANEGVWDWNLATNKIFASARFEQLVGKSVMKNLESNNRVSLEKNIYANMHPEDKPVYRANLINHLKGHAPTFECEFRVVRPGSKLQWIRNRGLALFDDEGRAYRMTGSLDDITARKQAEAALLEAKETAEIASRTKTDFLANVSHELRTPLNAIIGFSDLIKTEVFGAVGHKKYIDYIHTINDSGQHLLSIINDILDVSQVEVGELDFNPEKVFLNKIFDSCLGLIRERAEVNKLVLNGSIQGKIPPLKADPKRLKQILLNLLSNAVKFTPRGGSVTLKAHMTKAGTLVISIADTGIGMKQADIPKVMTPFAQVDSQLARKYDGTGLGLPLAKALVEMHGGHIKIRSKLRKGTTVSTYFPSEILVR